MPLRTEITTDGMIDTTSTAHRCQRLFLVLRERYTMYKAVNMKNELVPAGYHHATTDPRRPAKKKNMYSNMNNGRQYAAEVTTPFTATRSAAPIMSEMGRVKIVDPAVMPNVRQEKLNEPDVAVAELRISVARRSFKGSREIVDFIQSENPRGPSGVWVLIFMPKMLVVKDRGRKIAAKIVSVKTRRSCTS